MYNLYPPVDPSDLPATSGSGDDMGNDGDIGVVVAELEDRDRERVGSLDGGLEEEEVVASPPTNVLRRPKDEDFSEILLELAEFADDEVLEPSLDFR